MSNAVSSGEAAQSFPPTRWSVVLAAQQRPSPKSAAALEALCHAYWYPLYAYVRRGGQAPADAEDLTQEFFRRLLEKHWLNAADREKGRLRTFLIVSLKHFLAKEWRRASAKRRGGGQSFVPLDTAIAESRYAADPSTTGSAEAAFDRQWALILLDLTMNRLQKEFITAGKPGDFELLKDCLVAVRGSLDYAAVAARLGTSEGAARVAVHRLRKRYRELFREEIAQTVASPEEIAGEVQYLLTVLST